jgi:hypothetical protein
LLVDLESSFEVPQAANATDEIKPTKQSRIAFVDIARSVRKMHAARSGTRGGPRSSKRTCSPSAGTEETQLKDIRQCGSEVGFASQFHRLR